MSPSNPHFSSRENHPNLHKPMQALPRVPTLLVLALSIISLGIYSTYWLFTRTQIINRVHNEPISMHLAHSVIGLLMLNVLITFMSGFNPDNVAYREMATISGLIFSLASLFWVFTLRQRIHKMTRAGEQSLFWLNGIWTFLFQVLYLQYKINEYLNDNPSDSSLAV